MVLSAGLEARLYGRQDACRYNKQCYHARFNFGIRDQMSFGMMPMPVL